MNLIQEIKSHIDEAGLWEKEVELKRNEYLIVKGNSNSNLFYVMEGSLRIFIEDEYEEHTIRFGYQKDIITALDTFITGKPSFFYIQAIKKCRLKVVSRDRFMDMIQKNQKLLNIWQELLGQLIYQCLEREIDLLTFSPVERYKRVLERSPHLFQEIPSKYIASYLRMSPETLSRIKKS